MSAISHLKKLSDRLSRHDIHQLHDSLSVSDGVCDRDSDGTLFLTTLKRWKEFDRDLLATFFLLATYYLFIFLEKNKR